MPTMVTTSPQISAFMNNTNSDTARYKVDISNASKSEPSALKPFNAERNEFPVERQIETTCHKVCKLTSLIENEQRCHRGVGYKNSVSRFHLLVLSKCRKISKELFTGFYHTRLGDTFPIYEPKFRMVTSTPYRDRIPQSSFVKNVIYEKIIPKLVDNNLACRKGGGVDKARDVFEAMLKNAKATDVCICLDISNYFASINHEDLCSIIFELLGYEEYWAKSYYMDVINSNQVDVGIPLGSEIDQLSAVTFPHYIDDLLNDNNYIRYMDDIRYITDAETAKHLLEKLKFEFSKLHLKISEKKTYISPVTKPIVFLGFTYLKHPSGKITRKRLKQKLRNEKRKLLRMKKKNVPLAHVADHLRSARATMQKGCRSDLVKFDKYIKNLFGDEIMDIIKNNIEDEMHKKQQDAVIAMVKEPDENSDKINHQIREHGISPSQEFAILRKTLKAICEATGITIAEFEEHCKKIEKICEECQDRY